MLAKHIAGIDQAEALDMLTRIFPNRACLKGATSRYKVLSSLWPCPQLVPMVTCVFFSCQRYHVRTVDERPKPAVPEQRSCCNSELCCNPCVSGLIFRFAITSCCTNHSTLTYQLGEQGYAQAAPRFTPSHFGTGMTVECISASLLSRGKGLCREKHVRIVCSRRVPRQHSTTPRITIKPRGVSADFQVVVNQITYGGLRRGRCKNPTPGFEQ